MPLNVYTATIQARNAMEAHVVNDVKAGREFVQAYIGFVVYSHHLSDYVM